jgi:hypothetical protein
MQVFVPGFLTVVEQCSTWKGTNEKPRDLASFYATSHVAQD